MMFPRWISWMLLVVMGYVIYSASLVHSPMQPSNPVVVPITETNYPALAEMTDIERWKRKLNPDYAATMNCTLDKPATDDGLAFNVMENAPGEGAGASCGETITIHLTVWGSSGDKAFDGTLPLALGSRELASGLDAGLLGMKPGGVRMLVLPPYAVVRGKPAKGHAAALKALPSGKLAVVTVKRIK
jgi:hypothetical protein